MATGSKSTSQKITGDEILLFWHTSTNKLQELPGVDVKRLNITGDAGSDVAVLVIDGVVWDEDGNPVLSG